SARLILQYLVDRIDHFPLAQWPYEHIGNTPGNIANGGHAAFKDGWIYYSDENGMYAIKPDGTGKRKLCDSNGIIRLINVVGDRIYYALHNYNPDATDGLYTMKTDGTGGKKLYDGLIEHMHVVGDRIYFNLSMNTGIGFFAMKTDGTGLKRLYDDYASCINIAGDRIYFKNDSTDALCSIKTDGTDIKILNNDEPFVIQVVGDKIYYRIDPYKPDSAVYTINTDGTGRQKLLDDVSYWFNVSGDRIYYGNRHDENRLYSIKIDGTDRYKINDDSVGTINVVGDRLYYHSDNQYYSVKLDGTDRREGFDPPEPVIPDNMRPAVPPTLDGPFEEATTAVIKEIPDTFCNPLDIGYMYMTDYKSREAADPAFVVYKGDYYLFASHNAGYWWSSDLATWQYVYIDKNMIAQIDKFAPAVCVVKDGEGNEILYLTHSENGDMYKSTNPKAGEWTRVGHPFGWGDPALFTDDDGRVYCYFGLEPHSASPTGSKFATIKGVELDPGDNMKVIRGPIHLFTANPPAHGFEVPGNENQNTNGDCWLEGAWMVKEGGTYYLMYACPGTEYATYNNGVYTSDSPLGPFTFQEYSPVTFKPTGFVVGAGHGSAVEDLNGNWWAVNTVAISANTGFERRLIMTRVKFDEKGRMLSNCVRADYPQYVPYVTDGSYENPGPDWHLLGYNAAVTASSSLAGRPAGNAVNENIRSWWSAATGTGGEWLQVDFGKLCALNALQINFADQDVTGPFSGALGVNNNRNNTWRYKYTVDFSQDGETWYPLVDKSQAEGAAFTDVDRSHEYFELAKTIGVWYLRVTNRGPVPAGGKFAISGLRAFGYDPKGTAPAAPAGLTVNRGTDERMATVSWTAVAGAQGYIVRYGTDEDLPNLHYQVIASQVIGSTSVTIRSLNVGVDYYFYVDAYNDSGWTPGTDSVFSEGVATPPPPKPLPKPPPEIKPSAQDPNFTVYQADNPAQATLAGGVFAASDSGASNGKSIHDMHNAGAAITFPSVETKGGGNGILRVAYALDQSSSLELTVNGKSLGVIEMPQTGGWNTFKMVEMEIEDPLPAGNVVVKIIGGNGGVNVDFMQLIMDGA
ncbi:MAG: DUF5050 domain-containing protein, partial [Oscillospiraceae bacterium]|nr:DUF5050 domain-containing protein [Oscillospiraceae bacterium]